jgi:hypothetical protein
MKKREPAIAGTNSDDVVQLAGDDVRDLISASQ